MQIQPTPTTDSRRWLTLAVVCLAQLMIVLDTTIVNVALPSIQRDLHFSQGELTWVLNGFLVSFGSLLLLAGRLGDLVGRKRVFLLGVVIFTGASVLGGVAVSQGMLLAARFVQGIGAAAQASVILAIIVTEFPEAGERARAMSAYVFVSVAGGAVGLLAGGLLTEALSWHWIFFVNLPIGLVTIALGIATIPTDRGAGLGRGIDWVGSLLVSSSLMSLIYAIVQAGAHGWGSEEVLGFAGVAIVLMGAFIGVEATVESPIMPLRVLRLRGLVSANVVRGLLMSGMYGTMFLGSLYLQHVRHYSAIETGAAFLPWTITVAVLSRGITTRLMGRFGAVPVLTFGMGAASLGMVLFATAGPETAFFPKIFAAELVMGFGVGNAFTPLLTLAMDKVPPADAGLGSGITNVATQISGALGLAVLGTIATSHTKALIATNHGLTGSLMGGYHVAFLAGAGAIAAGVGLGLVLLRERGAKPSLHLAPAPKQSGDLVAERALEIERQAA